MTAAEDGAIAELLLRDEQRLMDPRLRKDRDQVSELLATDFREFGSSGRVFSRQAILDQLASEPAQSAPSVCDFAIQRIGPQKVLATYRAVRPGASPDTPSQTTLRSSLWIERANRWQILFHQGTQVTGS